MYYDVQFKAGTPNFPMNQCMVVTCLNVDNSEWK